MKKEILYILDFVLIGWFCSPAQRVLTFALLSAFICVHPRLNLTAAQITLPMATDPAVEVVVPERVYDDQLNDLWIEALGRPEVELRLQAADAFRRAWEGGMQPTPAAVEAVAKRVKEDESEMVRMAAVEALGGGGELPEDTVTPSLPDLQMTWDRAAARAAGETNPQLVNVWRERLLDDSAAVVSRISAAWALAEAGESQVAGAAELAKDTTQPPTLRLAAAKLAGAPHTDAGLGEAAEIDPRLPIVEQLIAIRLTRDARTLLRTAGDPTSPRTVAAEAARRLPTDMLAQHPELISSTDPIVRRLTLAAAGPGQSPQWVAQRLDDHDLAIRTLARQQLVERGNESASALLEALNGSDWRPLEQAALAVGVLDVEDAADRLVELLTHDRPEVRVAAAQALRQVAVERVLPAMRARAQSLIDSEAAMTLNGTAELAQLVSAFGPMGDAEAEPLLRSLIPKTPTIGSQARAAAIWSLGKLHEGEKVADLQRPLLGRLADTQGMEPESADVQQQAAITLGRIGDDGAVSGLRKAMAEFPGLEVGEAARWAIGEITGESPPPPDVEPSRVTGWFLEPVR